MPVVVKGIGVTGGFGSGVGDFTRALATGESRIGLLPVPTGQGLLELPAFRADTDQLDDFIPRRNLRRTDHYSKLALLGASLALADAAPAEPDRHKMGVIVASGYGGTAATFAFLDSFINDGDICASPTHFANSVHNAAAASIAIQLGITGPNLTVSQFAMSVPVALLTAHLWLAEKRVETVLLGGVDELSDLIGYTWFRQRGMAEGPMAPLQTGRESGLPGEGAAFLLLSRVDGASGGYCTIDAVEAGARAAGAPPFPADRLLLLGADGRRELGERYRTELPAGAPVACYTPLYGSMPAAAAFDLAAAALMLKSGRIFPSPGGECDLAANRPVEGPFAGPGRISCLTLAGDQEYGLATLGGL